MWLSVLENLSQSAAHYANISPILQPRFNVHMRRVRSVRRINLYLVLSSMVILAACATNPKVVDCRHINWQRVGQQDGEQGKYHQDLSSLFPSCGGNIIVEHAAYQAGWSQGITKYCQPRNAFKLGSEGKLRNTLCPALLETAFSQAWSDGIRHFCTPSNGYKLGLTGKDSPQICPTDLNIEYQHAYQRGYIHYQQIANLKTHLDTVRSQLNDVQHNREQQQEQLQTLQATYAKQSFSPEQQYKIQKNEFIDETLNEKRSGSHKRKAAFKYAI